MEPQESRSLASCSIIPPTLDERFLTALSKGLMQAVFVVESNSLRIVHWNDTAEALFLFSEDEILHESIERLFTGRRAFERICVHALSDLKERGFWRGEGQYRRRDGSLFVAETTEISLTTETGSYIVVLAHEISESQEHGQMIHWLNQELAQRFSEPAFRLIAQDHKLQKAESERRQSERLLHVLMRNLMNNAILFLSAEGYVINSKGTEQLLGYVAEDLDGIHFSRLFEVGPGDQRRWSEMLECAMQQSTVRHYDWLLRKDGLQLHARVEIVALRETAGTRNGYIVFLRDDTEQKRIRDQLREKEHLASIGTATAMLAHEIRNPLNGMSTTVQFLDRSLRNGFEPTKEIVIRTVHDLKNEISRLQALLSDFHAISYLNKINAQKVNLTELIRGLIPLAMPESLSARFKIVEEFDGGLFSVIADPDKLKQVFLNIIKNAFEAMPDGGTLTVKTLLTGAAVSVEISDTGDGIPEGLNVFDLFRSTKVHGTGLGLAIARQIVLAHAGSIDYASRVGAGTSFRVILPIGSSSEP